MKSWPLDKVEGGGAGWELRKFERSWRERDA